MINNISFPGLGIDITVNRAAFTIGGFPIYWYGIIIACGLLIGAIYGFKECAKTGVNADDFLNMLIIAIPVSIICARLYFVIFSPDLFRDDFSAVFDIRSGGLAVYGGIIGAAAVIFLYCRKKKINMGKILDILAVGLLIGQALGRWGNFVNGEAFGSVTILPWGMTIKSDGVLIAESVHPTFLYESLWNLVGLAIILIYKKNRTFFGELMCIYLMWYGTGRAVIEGLRTDSLYFGPFRVSQLLSLILVIVGLVVFVVNKIKKTE